MNKYPILVLDADGRAGVACVQSLGRLGHRIHVGVRRRGSTTEHSRWCHDVHPQPAAEPVEPALRWLLELDARHDFTLVLATTEASLRWLQALAEDHPLRRKAVLPSNAALESALHKAITHAIARELGLPVPDSRDLPQRAPGEAADEPQGIQRRYPLVLKPVRSKVVIGSRLMSLAVAIVHDEETRRSTLEAWLPFTAVQEQQWVPGRGVGVEVLYDNGRCAWHFVHERLHEWPLTGGASTLRRAGGPELELVAMTQRLLDRLGWHGAAMVEWRRDDQGRVHLMEINPRLWGSLPLTIAAGVDVPRGLLALARGEALPASPRWRVGHHARNVPDDLQWFIDNLRADRRDPLLLTEAPWRTALGWLRGLFVEAWDGWSLRDPGVALAELRAMTRDRAASVARRIDRRAALARAKQRHAALCDESGLLARPPTSVLFLCLGNICRSPFAQVAAARRLPAIPVSSAGFLHHDGRPSPMHVVSAAQSLGIDLSAARAQRVSAEQVASADLVVCMDLSHLNRFAAEFPDALAKTTLLGLFAPLGPAEIRDPYDLSPAATREVLTQMLSSIDALAAACGASRAPG